MVLQAAPGRLVNTYQYLLACEVYIYSIITLFLLLLRLNVHFILSYTIHSPPEFVLPQV